MLVRFQLGLPCDASPQKEDTFLLLGTTLIMKNVPRAGRGTFFVYDLKLMYSCLMSGLRA